MPPAALKRPAHPRGTGIRRGQLRLLAMAATNFFLCFILSRASAQTFSSQGFPLSPQLTPAHTVDLHRSEVFNKPATLDWHSWGDHRYPILCWGMFFVSYRSSSSQSLLRRELCKRYLLLLLRPHPPSSCSFLLPRDQIHAPRRRTDSFLPCSAHVLHVRTPMRKI